MLGEGTQSLNTWVFLPAGDQEPFFSSGLIGRLRKVTCQENPIIQPFLVLNKAPWLRVAVRENQNKPPGHQILCFSQSLHQPWAEYVWLTSVAVLEHSVPEYPSMMLLEEQSIARIG